MCRIRATIQVGSLLLAFGAAANAAWAQTPRVAPRNPFVTGSPVLLATDFSRDPGRQLSDIQPI